MKKLYENKKLIIIIGGIVFLIFLLVLYLFNDSEEIEEDIVINITTEKIKTEEMESFYVDIKGSVKNPGVYKFKEGKRIIDAINEAGGLKKNADTSNINLSKKLTNEMVIYVYNNNEIKNKDSLSCNNICNVEVIEVNNCIENNDTNNKEPTNDLVNINTASIEELQTITGIGESKAKSIIEYRSNNGSFKAIDEIKNVSGIGDALFEKIKDKITI